LWRAVDQDGEVVDVYLQAKRDGAAAKRFFKRLLRNHGGEPMKVVTDKLRTYGVPHRELSPESILSTKQYESNRAEQSHEATRVRERGMRKFESVRSKNGVGRLLEIAGLVYLGLKKLTCQYLVIVSILLRPLNLVSLFFFVVLEKV
jgi:putative transposase